MSEWTLMLRGIWALFYRSANIKPFVDADLALELTMNSSLKDSIEKQENFRREYTPTVRERLHILRRNLFGSLFLLATAMVLALLILRLSSRPHPNWLGAASVFFLAWSTLARLGYAGKSFGGNSIIERLDERIFKTLFWIGTFLGILALS
jgi:hypothetical protein